MEGAFSDYAFLFLFLFCVELNYLNAFEGYNYGFLTQGNLIVCWKVRIG